MSAKLDNVILEAVKLRKTLEYFPTRGGSDNALKKLMKALLPLINAVAAAKLVPGEAELVFVLNPKDLVTVPTINYWLVKAEQAGAQGETLEEVRRKRQAIENWQQDIANMRHVKVPT